MARNIKEDMFEEAEQALRETILRASRIAGNTTDPDSLKIFWDAINGAVQSLIILYFNAEPDEDQAEG